MTLIFRDYLYEITLIIGVIIFIWRQLYVRANHDAYLREHGYKPGSTEDKNINTMTSISAICIVGIVGLLIAAKLFFDVHTIVHSSYRGKQGALVGIPIVVIVFYGVLWTIAYNIMEKPYKDRRNDDDKNNRPTV